MSISASPSRSARRKSVRITTTAFVGIAGTAAATALPAAPAQAARAYEVFVRAWGLNAAKGMQVCGHNQNGQGECHYAQLSPAATAGSQNWSTPNWWWASKITLWWSNHHSKSNATCNVQTTDHSGNWAEVAAWPPGDGGTNCSIQPG
jgi:hypothetical protein